MCPFKKWPLSLSHSNYFPFYCIFETILVWSAVRKLKSCYKIPHRIWTTCLKNHLILIARYVEINSVMPMWPISQMARGLYGCNREQSPSNLRSLMQYHTGVFLNRKPKGRGTANWFSLLVFLNVIMANDPRIVSRSIFCSNNNKKGNIYMQIWAPAKKTSQAIKESYSCSNFPHCRREDIYWKKAFTEKISKPISLTHVLHISWQGKYSRFCLLSSFDRQNTAPPSQMCHHAGLLSKQFKQEMLDWQLNSITLFS